MEWETDITVDMGSGVRPCVLVNTVIDDWPSWCFRNGSERLIRCIIDLTFTSMVWSKSGIVHPITPFYTTIPWQRIIASR